MKNSSILILALSFFIALPSYANPIYEKNNFMTTGGTTASKVIIEVKYSENEILKHESGDLIKIYD